jgi:hypothetical protein
VVRRAAIRVEVIPAAPSEVPVVILEQASREDIQERAVNREPRDIREQAT